MLGVSRLLRRSRRGDRRLLGVTVSGAPNSASNRKSHSRSVSRADRAGAAARRGSPSIAGKNVITAIIPIRNMAKRLSALLRSQWANRGTNSARSDRPMVARCGQEPGASVGRFHPGGDADDGPLLQELPLPLSISERCRPWSCDASAAVAVGRSPGWRGAAPCSCPTSAGLHGATGGDK